jgi:16S rRNA (cytosine967-C5)-methyltransferase
LSGSRLAAARVLHRVVEGESLSTGLPAVLLQLGDAQQHAFVQALSYGAVRFFHRLSIVLDLLMPRPLKPRDRDLRCLILTGLYELYEQRTPGYAVVSEWVDCADKLGKTWAKGLVNGILRNFIRRREELLARAMDDPVARYASPAWLIDILRRDWPDDWQALLEAGNSRAPMVLRVNLSKTTRASYLQRLEAEGIAAEAMDAVESAVRLAVPVDVDRLPGFATGLVSVQDAAAQLAAVLLDPQAGDRVLDACAAPGGKAMHLLERQPRLAELVAVERDSARVKRMDENFIRAGEVRDKVNIKLADAADTEAWWDGQPFQRILLDAPCTASGVIRRHPDIKLLRRREDLAALAAAQAELLNRLWPLLAPGGVLLYCTCSIFKQENERQAETFLARTRDACPVFLGIPFARDRDAGWQILPGTQADTDGFFYAAFSKIRMSSRDGSKPMR